MTEYWDVYDKNRALTGKTIQRGEPFGEGEYYVCCEIWIINSKNEILVTQRHPDKKAGGLWEFTGGGVLAGETTDSAAVREVREELGISMKESELELLDVYQFRNYFMDIYLARKDFDTNDLVLDSTEVVDAKWLSQDQVFRLIRENKMVRSVAMRFDCFHSRVFERLNEQALIAFSEPYYADKDIMHNMWHIELVKKMVDKISSVGKYEVDRDLLLLATYFHGFIYKDEERIKTWMTEQGYSEEFINKTLQIAWESQRSEVPETLEGKILHDAHVLEGGKTYLIVKTLITGSVRGQSLPDTLKYMKDNVLEKNECYLPETIPLCTEMNQFANAFYKALVNDIQG